MRAAEERRYTEYVTERLPVLRRTALLLCGDRHRADDVVQAAITRLYLHWNRASAARNMDAYVRTIVVRAFLNEQRRGWFQRVSLVGGPGETPVPPAPSGPDVELRSVVDAALARVPPRQRAALVLRFLCDLSVAEVAEHLGCSVGNVKSLTTHGLRALRRQFGEHPMTTLGME